MRIMFLASALFAILTSAGVSQVPAPSDYFPYQVGDTLQYFNAIGGGSIITTYFIDDSVDEFGSRFLFANKEGRFVGMGNYEVDTNYNVFTPTKYDYWTFKINAQVGESWPRIPPNDIFWTSLTREFDTTVFGIPTSAKEFELYYGDSSGVVRQVRRTRVLAAGFGEIINYTYEGAYYIRLLGAVIGGKHYGVLHPYADVKESVMEETAN